ncbi:hypothetical protein F4779DRAFT_620868 [Xylariaceae sp. FL0662B]|nr:hypothetical protein F4779DRAFT_620868 [Xylariaceae sp. FL0662B]
MPILKSNQHREGRLTEVGLLRTGEWALLEGHGFESNPEKANRGLVSQTSLT